VCEQPRTSRGNPSELKSMPKELPEGWVLTTIGEVCAINPRPSNDELPAEQTEVSFVPMAAVEQETGLLDPSESRILAETRKGYTPFKENDVIFAKITPCMENGKVALAKGLRNGIAYGSTEFFVLRPYEGILPRYLLHYLLQRSFRNAAQRTMTGAVGQKRVPKAYLAAHSFPLPPVHEQERIVAKLDTMLSRVASGEAAARRALERLQRYRASVLNAAVTGELTREWREKHKPDETGAQLLERLLSERRTCWEEAELQRIQAADRAPNTKKWKRRYSEPVAPKASDVHEVPCFWAWASVEQLNPGDRACAYGVLQPGPHDPRGVLLVRVGDINNGKISIEGIKRISPSIAEKYDRTILQGGELLITLVGTIGRTAVVPDELIGANTARAVGVIPLMSSVNPDWVELWFRSPFKHNEMVGKAHEVARKTLNLGDVRSASVLLPPPDEQQEIVRETHRRLTSADQLKDKLNQQLNRGQATRQSLLHEAFSGRLVQQNPRDESASVLLKRIRTNLEAKKVSRKQRMKPRAKLAQKQSNTTKAMNQPIPTAADLENAWQRIDNELDAKKLFDAAGYSPDQAINFYEDLRKASGIINAFQRASKRTHLAEQPSFADPKLDKPKPGRFRLVSLWLEDFKNLKDYEARFDAMHVLEPHLLVRWL